MLGFTTRIHPGDLTLAANSLTLKRKSPKQARSKATVEAILEATARVLVDDGFDRATTNRIAEVAGVSVGSLYQYFPNKRALVRALLDRHHAEAVAMLPPGLADGAPTPLRKRIRLAVDWWLAAHAQDPALHAVLSDVGREIYGPEHVRHLEKLYHRRLRGILANHADEVAPTNLDIAAFILAQTLEALTHGAVVHHPELLANEELADEMTALITGYLCREDAAARASA